MSITIQVVKRGFIVAPWRGYSEDPDALPWVFTDMESLQKALPELLAATVIKKPEPVVVVEGGCK